MRRMKFVVPFWFPQSAALRHALLLEERGLQLERAEALLRQKAEAESRLKSELRRLGEAAIADRYVCFCNVTHDCKPSRGGFAPRLIGGRAID